MKDFYEKKELDYFTIDGGVGGNQDWFQNVVMYMGGCAAATASSALSSPKSVPQPSQIQWAAVPGAAQVDGTSCTGTRS